MSLDRPYTSCCLWETIKKKIPRNLRGVLKTFVCIENILHSAGIRNDPNDVVRFDWLESGKSSDNPVRQLHGVYIQSDTMLRNHDVKGVRFDASPHTTDPFAVMACAWDLRFPGVALTRS